MSDETISQPRIKITWLIGTVVAFGLFVAIGAYSKRMTRDYVDYDQDRAAQRYETLAKLRQDEGKLLNPVDAQGHSTAEWVDQANGLIRIPIEEAMAKEVDALKDRPAAASVEINPPTAVLPAAAAPPASAPSTAPATPAAKKPATPPTAGLPSAGASAPAPTNKPNK